MAETDKKDQVKKTKRPTAEKRVLQTLKRQGVNQMFKSRVKTAIRRFEDLRKQGSTSQVKEQLDEVYSLMDKGEKRGVFKGNKASRTKSRLAAKVASQK